jgi:hypothetical protein
LFTKTAEPAGFIEMEEKSPPNAPNAPPIARNLAVPFILSIEYRTASEISCDCAAENVNAAISSNDFFMILNYGLKEIPMR